MELPKGVNISRWPRFFASLRIVLVLREAEDELILDIEDVKDLIP